MRDADSTASLEDYKLAPLLITIMMGDISGGPSRWRPPTTTHREQPTRTHTALPVRRLKRKGQREAMAWR